MFAVNPLLLVSALQSYDVVNYFERPWCICRLEEVRQASAGPCVGLHALMLLLDVCCVPVPVCTHDGTQVCMLLQTLSQSFMANPAAAHGLSAALAPPASTSGGNSASTRSVAGGAATAGPGPTRDNASQHTVAVSLGKAWLELLVKLLRRASEGKIAAAGPGVVSSGAGESTVVAAALEDSATRDALLILFERTAAGVAAAAAAASAASAAASSAATAVGTTDASLAAASSFASLGSSSGDGRKVLAWADPALVLRSLVLLREVLARVPDAYVVPLRRRGVLHRLVVTHVCTQSTRALVLPWVCVVVTW